MGGRTGHHRRGEGPDERVRADRGRHRDQARRRRLRRPNGTAFDHRITFGGNPVSCAAGLANLDILQRELLVRNAADMGGYLFGRLQDLYRYDIVGQVRGGLGLICAVEIAADRTTREPFPKKAGLARRAGRLMERHGLLGRAGNIGQAIDPDDLPGFGLYQWELPSDNPWWSRPLKLGEIGCAISHWMCWQQAPADAADPALILEDDAVLPDHCAARLQLHLSRLWTIDPRWDLLYLGRWALDDADRTVTQRPRAPWLQLLHLRLPAERAGAPQSARLRFRTRADPSRRAAPRPLPGPPARRHPVVVSQTARGVRPRAPSHYATAQGRSRK
ncbi:MAG TPA: aminotransferase class III-fold pyridoxal phosphate-dependent enzyme [Trebonia sp.]